MLCSAFHQITKSIKTTTKHGSHFFTIIIHMLTFIYKLKRHLGRLKELELRLLGWKLLI